MRLTVVAFALALGLTGSLHAQPPQLVAPTGPLTPAEERKALVVPEGFEVQLVAAEPDIQKPMQIAFDARGRLWVTTSYHYPFAGPKGKSTDKLFVLSDFGPDGRARKVQTFADFLNIPIGILPLPDCKSCIVSSVGEILKLTDTDGDGKADKTEVLFSGFGFRDTHGMYNSFTLMPDGWVYACHGFSNSSKVKGKDGHEVEMQSGNTFRFRPDGSRIETHTRGQVNPFGIAVDPWFNLYTADCHSKPITQLIPGAYYDSFGKPHDGLGFAPHVTPHDHGSTGLCGLTWYDADQFPKEFKGCMFLGNVVTNRINFDRIEWKGATPVAKELPDFLVSKDPWFRPADIKLGPDGALYVTDFYNKIIGHYEVDLRHPGRDKDRGRVWRIVWKGKDGKAAPPKVPFADLTKDDVREVFNLLDSPNLTTRLLATNQLIHRADEFQKALEAGVKPRPPFSDRGTVHAGWQMFRLGSNPAPGLVETLATAKPHRTPFSTSHELRKAKALPTWNDDLRSAVTSCLKDEPTVQRAAVEAIAAHPHPDFVRPLVDLLKKLPPEDTHLRQAARIALRNQFWDVETKAARDVREIENDPAGSAILANVVLGVPTSHSARFLATHYNWRSSDAALPTAAEHIGHYGDPDGWKPVLTAVNEIDRFVLSPGELRQRLLLLRQLQRGIQASGKTVNDYPVVDLFGRLSQIEIERLADPATAQAYVEVFTQSLGLTDPKIRPEVEKLTSQAFIRVLQNPKLAETARVHAAEILGRVDPTRATPTMLQAMGDPKASSKLKEQLLIALSTVPSREARGEVNAALKGVPYRVAVAVALNMAATKIGGEELLASVKAGFMPARVLQEKLVLERLTSSKVENLDKQLAELTKGLQPADKKLAELIKQRTTRFASTKPDKELGAKLFTKHCAACHKIGDQGGKVGPQLDGVGVRGLERLLEDVIDPNRNVDAAFRARVLNLTDGTTKTGLMLRVEGEVLVMADNEGKEFRVPTKEVESNRETALSPMPANFGEAIPEAEFYHLVAYLLDQRVKDSPKK